MGAEPKQLTAKEYVKAYLNLKSALDAKRKAYQKEEKDFKGKMAYCIEQVRKIMQDAGDIDSLKLSDLGIAFYKTTKFVTVDDWSKVMEYVRKKNLWHILGKAVAKTAVIEVLESTKKAIPGLTLGSKKELHINKR